MGPTTTTSALGPGVGAFIAFFFLAVALYFLMRNMNGRMRRMAYRERDRLADLEADASPRAGEGGSPESGSGGASVGEPGSVAPPTDAP